MAEKVRGRSQTRRKIQSNSPRVAGGLGRSSKFVTDLAFYSEIWKGTERVSENESEPTGSSGSDDSPPCLIEVPMQSFPVSEERADGQRYIFDDLEAQRTTHLHLR